MTERPRYSGVWTSSQVSEYLREVRVPLRLSCVTQSGWPLIVSLWFDWHDDALWCATQRTARVAAHLEREPRCGFEIATNVAPYRGVRGQGVVDLLEEAGPGVLDRLITRYLDDPAGGFARWLRSRSDDEVAIRIRPRWFTSWDFAARMDRSE